MLKVANFSYHKWPARLGGVERFGHLLQKATGCDWYPLGASVSKKYDIIISDSGLGFSHGKFKIVFVHGTWKQLYLNCNMDIAPCEATQADAFRRADILVASSKGVARQLYTHYQLEPHAIIPHGIDLTNFYPREKPSENKKPLVLHCATDFIKHQSDIVPLQLLLPEFKFEPVWGDTKRVVTGADYARGDIFLHWSSYEGNAYAPMEAIACGIPTIVTNVGYFADYPDSFNKVVDVVDRNIEIKQLANFIRELWEEKALGESELLRKLAQKYFNYERFKADWIMLLDRYHSV